MRSSGRYAAGAPCGDPTMMLVWPAGYVNEKVSSRSPPGSALATALVKKVEAGQLLGLKPARADWMGREVVLSMWPKSTRAPPCDVCMYLDMCVVRANMCVCKLGVGLTEWLGLRVR